MRDNRILRHYRNPLFWTFIVIALLIITLALLGLYFSRQQRQLQNQLNTTNQYSSSMVLLAYELTSAESAQRGYLITQDPSYLKPYNAALPLIHKSIKDIQATPQPAAYKKRVANILNLSNAKLNEMAVTISTLQSGGQPAAFAIVGNGRGQSYMTSIIADITSVLTDQTAKLTSRERSVAHLSDIIDVITPATAIVALLLMLLAIWMAQRIIKHRELLEGSREQLVTIASHQLRTPATAVKQYLHLLLDDYYGPVMPAQRKILRTINTSNDRGIAIANSLLNVTKADAGEINISADPVNLNHLLQEVVDQYQPVLKKGKQQQIVTKLPKKPVMAKVDPFYMKMVFENLIDNASKYSPSGKKIFVALSQPDGNVNFSVRDQGEGISKSDIPKLFKRFSRLSDPLTAKVYGSGLGLYLTRQLAILHGGDITVETSDKGSTFLVTFKADHA